MATDPLRKLSGPGKPLKAELHHATNAALSLESRFDPAYDGRKRGLACTLPAVGKLAHAPKRHVLRPSACAVWYNT